MGQSIERQRGANTISLTTINETEKGLVRHEFYKTRKDVKRALSGGFGAYLKTGTIDSTKGREIIDGVVAYATALDAFTRTPGVLVRFATRVHRNHYLLKEEGYLDQLKHQPRLDAFELPIKEFENKKKESGVTIAWSTQFGVIVPKEPKQTILERVSRNLRTQEQQEKRNYMLARFYMTLVLGQSGYGARPVDLERLMAIDYLHSRGRSHYFKHRDFIRKLEYARRARLYGLEYGHRLSSSEDRATYLGINKRQSAIQAIFEGVRYVAINAWEGILQSRSATDPEKRIAECVIFDHRGVIKDNGHWAGMPVPDATKKTYPGLP